MTSPERQGFVGDNIAALYFAEKEMKGPLLTPEQEQALGRKIQTGIRAQERISQNGTGLTPQEKKDLAMQINEGETAAKTLTEKNLLLVVSVAGEYHSEKLRPIDLIQEGNIGLMRAVRKFDPERGLKFSTYAIHWIRQTVSRAVANQGRTIRLPMHRVELLYKINKTSRNLTAQLNREPTIKEIAKQLGKKPEVVEEVLRQAISPISLDKEIGEETTLREMIEDKETSSPLQDSEKTLLGEKIKEVIGALSERERRILELRFGFLDGQRRTLEEIGEEFGVTRERVRQIEAEALRKLRHPSRARKIKDFLE